MNLEPEKSSDRIADPRIFSKSHRIGLGSQGLPRQYICGGGGERAEGRKRGINSINCDSAWKYGGGFQARNTDGSTCGEKVGSAEIAGENLRLKTL